MNIRGPSLWMGVVHGLVFAGSMASNRRYGLEYVCSIGSNRRFHGLESQVPWARIAGSMGSNRSFHGLEFAGSMGSNRSLHGLELGEAGVSYTKKGEITPAKRGG